MSVNPSRPLTERRHGGLYDGPLEHPWKQSHYGVRAFPADLFYREGEILRQADETAQLALLSGIVVTTIYIIGLLLKKKPRILGMGIDSILVLAVYLGSVYVFYTVR